MHLRSLIHLLEAVNALVRPDSMAVLGSSSLLAVAADLGAPGQPLEVSMDADLLISPCDDRVAAVLHEAVGEDSLFHREYHPRAKSVKRSKMAQDGDNEPINKAL